MAVTHAQAFQCQPRAQQSVRRAERCVANLRQRDEGWTSHEPPLVGEPLLLSLLRSATVPVFEAQEIFGSTTLLTHSDFARTLTPNSTGPSHIQPVVTDCECLDCNETPGVHEAKLLAALVAGGDGTDHGWGGNYVMLGGTWAALVMGSVDQALL